eukprot:4681819-Heterocapsa_arctica.AAC.1
MIKDKTLEMNAMSSMDDANRCVSKEIEAKDYKYTFVFQDRMHISDEKMEYQKERMTKYIGDDTPLHLSAWALMKYNCIVTKEAEADDYEYTLTFQKRITIRST